MTAPPMRRSQNLLALAAVVLAAGSLLPLPPAARLTCAVLAILIVVALFAARLRMHRLRPGDSRSDAHARAAKIRADRANRRRR
jgi:hypothetical protein